MPIAFEPSPEFSVGIELEYQLVDADSLDLVDGVLPLLELSANRANIKPEHIQNTVEVVSSPCDGVDALAGHVVPIVHRLQRECSSLGLRLCGSGTHPFNSARATITPLPRYLEMMKSSGAWMHNQITFATHVHIGVTSGNEAVTVMAGLKPYLPLIIAMSGNSPFWRSEDTDFAAFRHRLLAPSRSYGLPPDFGSWRAFQRFYNAMKASGRMSHIDEMHWDIRPRPHLGTVELRVADAQTRVVEALAIAAFVRALVRFLRSEREFTRHVGLPPRSLPWWAHKDNCYIASRNGLSSKLINSARGDVVPVAGLIAETLSAVEPHARRLGEDSYLTVLERMIARGGPYSEQRRLLREHGSLSAVVRVLSDRLLDSVPLPV